jgi:hypothetical protein
MGTKFQLFSNIYLKLGSQFYLCGKLEPKLKFEILKKKLELKVNQGLINN